LTSSTPLANLHAERLHSIENLMAKVTYIEPDGNEHVLDIVPGLSVMEGAVNNNVRGIIAECRGACSCATCHVYVDPSWTDKVGAKSGTEEAMLDCVCDPHPNSRLSCQIKVTEQLEGLVVRLPEKQS
jgi:2Fe-2S ferredoxin